MKPFKHIMIVMASLALCAALLSCDDLYSDLFKEIEVTGIEITASPDRTVYGMGETIDFTGLMIRATFSDNATQESYAFTASDIDISSASFSPGIGIPVTVNINSYKDTFNIDVFPVVSMSSAEVYTGYDDLNAALTALTTGDTITLYADQTINNNINPAGKAITLQGYGSERKITHIQGAPMFNISGSATTLVLGDKLTLNGDGDNNGANPLVMVAGSATLRMEAGSTITGGRTTGHGGGVYIDAGTFNMAGGTISGNSSHSHGGGVYVNAGTFTMDDGTISSNTTTNNSGGGVAIANSSVFQMQQGTISGNTAQFGGGVFIMTYSTFNMAGGTIKDNRTSISTGTGGGVFIASFGTFAYASGTFTGNTASDGNQVYKDVNSAINGGGSVSVGAGSNIPYNNFP